MKLRVLSSLLSVVSLAVLVPACGDDDGAVGPEDPSEDAGETDGEPGDDDAGGGGETSENGPETTGGEETPASEVDGGPEVPSDLDGGTETTAAMPDGGPVDTTTGGEQTTEPPPDVDCPDIAERTPVEVPTQIDEDTEWTCDNVYTLPENAVTLVTDGATLTIRPGVEVWGRNGSALVITRGSKIDANGQANAPIVFTSEAVVRAPGQWGGVLLLGGAPVNDAAGVSNAEGITSTGGYSEYGGEDEDFDCGSMSYVRIEFGGYELSPDNELNNLGVAGCGTETELHHIQVHKGSDDGIEFWGGSPTVHHIVSSSNSDDSFDWAAGFSSEVQFLVIQQNPGDADMGFEADGNEDNYAATPPSSPTFYNVTAIGGEGQTGDSYGAVLRRGTAGKFYNSIFMGFGSPALDVRDYESVAFADGESPMLTVENTLFFNNGGDGETHLPVGDINDCTEQLVDSACEADYFDEVAYFTAEAKNNVFDEDPELGDPNNLTDPDFVPAADSPAAEGGATPPSGLVDVTYLGAFEPGGSDWTAGWTAYPEN